MNVLALHGFTGSTASFDDVGRRLDGQKLWAPALLGHQGRAPTDQDASSFEGEVERLGALLSGKRWFVVGYSMGARLGLGLLSRFGHRISGALLIGVNPGLSDPAEREARRRSDEGWCQLLRERGIEAFAAAWQAQPLFASQNGLAPAVLTQQQEIRLAHHPDGLCAALRRLGLGNMPNYRPMLPTLDLPILLATGELDPKFSAIAAQMVDNLPHAALARVPGAGHNLVLERPDWVASRILQKIG